MNPIDSNNRFGSAALNLAALTQNRGSVADRIQAARARIQSNIIGRMNLPETQGPIQQPQPQDIPETPLDNIFNPPATPAPPAATPAPPVATPAPPVATPAPPVATPAPPVATPAPPVATPAPPTPAVPTGPAELGPISEVTTSFSNNIQPGSLLLADEFTPIPSGPTHGEVVTASAQETGFQGPIERLNVSELDGVKANHTAQGQAANVLGQANLSQQDTLAALGQATEASFGVVLESGIGALDSALAGGAENSVLNLSLGASSAGMTSFILDNVMAGASAPEGSPGRNASVNMTQAFGVDIEQLTSSDPSVSQPARTRFAERTGQFVEGVVASSPEIAQGKQEWDQKMAQFESSNNSVVMSTGNSGAFVDNLEAQKGSALDVSGNFQRSILANSDATVVSATIEVNGREVVANYASDSPAIDVFASGTHDPNSRVSGDEHFGTSFAAPTVAATMARLHVENPNLSSNQIQNLLLRDETNRIAGDNGLISTLNSGPINEPQAPESQSPAPQDRFSRFFSNQPREDIRSRFLDIFGT